MTTDEPHGVEETDGAPLNTAQPPKQEGAGFPQGRRGLGRTPGEAAEPRGCVRRGSSPRGALGPLPCPGSRPGAARAPVLQEALCSRASPAESSRRHKPFPAAAATPQERLSAHRTSFVFPLMGEACRGPAPITCSGRRGLRLPAPGQAGLPHARRPHRRTLPALVSLAAPLLLPAPPPPLPTVPLQRAEPSAGEEGVHSWGVARLHDRVWPPECGNTGPITDPATDRPTHPPTGPRRPLRNPVKSCCSLSKTSEFQGSSRRALSQV